MTNEAGRRHSTFVEPVRGTWDAGCDCGWESVEWDDEEAAGDAADRHMREMGQP